MTALRQRRAPGSPLLSEEATVRTHRALGNATRSRLLSLLRAADGPRSVGRLAEALDLHPNSVRDQLEPLLELGLVERRSARPAGRGRPGHLYTASKVTEELPPGSGGASEGEYRTLAAILADQLAEAPDRRSRAEAAGERWGRTMVAGSAPAPTAPAGLAALVAVLDEAGFRPDRRLDGDGTLGLRRCPFATIVGGRMEVVCGIHLGLMRGALEGLGAPLRAERLEPFVRPDLCRAQLVVAADA